MKFTSSFVSLLMMVIALAILHVPVSMQQPISPNSCNQGNCSSPFECRGPYDVCCQGRCVSGNLNDTCNPACGCNSEFVCGTNNRCVRPVLIGCACTLDRVCESRRCVGGVCAPLRAGDVCRYDCFNKSLTCNAVNFTTAICAELFPNGANCNDDRQCQSDRCINNECGTPLAVGAVCTSSDECRSRVCHVNGTCIAQFSLPLGAECNEADACSSFLCGEDNGMSGTSTRRCQTLLTKANGQPCGIKDTCQSDICVCTNANCTTAACSATLQRLGSPCTGSEECENGTICLGNICARPYLGGAGSTCDPSQRGDCGMGLICDINTQQCIAAPTFCERDSNCANNQACICQGGEFRCVAQAGGNPDYRYIGFRESYACELIVTRGIAAGRLTPACYESIAAGNVTNIPASCLSVFAEQMCCSSCAPDFQAEVGADQSFFGLAGTVDCATFTINRTPAPTCASDQHFTMTGCPSDIGSAVSVTISIAAVFMALVLALAL